MQSVFSAVGRTATLTLLLIFVGALTPDAVSAQSTGCPWCTTPTTCAEVDENTDIGGCYNIGAGCEEFDGSCTLEPDRIAAAEREKLFDASGVQYLGTVTASLLGADIKASDIGSGLHAQWSCNGILTALFTKTEAGEWEEIDATPHRARLNLNFTAAASD